MIASPPQKRRGLRVIYLFCNDGVPDIAVCLSCGNHLVAGGNKVGVSALSRAVCGVKVDESTALDFDGSGARLIIIIKAVQKESGFRLGVLLNKVKETALNNELASLNIYGVNIADELAILDNNGSSVANINCIAVVISPLPVTVSVLLAPRTDRRDQRAAASSQMSFELPRVLPFMSRITFCSLELPMMA